MNPDLVLMLLMLVLSGLVTYWIHADSTEHTDHDPNDWP